MTLLALVFAVVAAEPSSPHPVTVAFSGLNAVNLVAGEGSLRTEVLAQKLMARGIKVITDRDLASVLGVERQQQLLGCGQSGSCAVEMLAAAGAAAVVVGDLGNLGGQYTLTIKAISTSDGKVLATYTGKAKNETELTDTFDDAVRVLSSGLFAKFGGQAVPEVVQRAPEVSEHPLRVWSIAPAVVAALGVASGVTFKLLGDADYRSLSPPLMTGVDANKVATQGKTFDAVMVGSFIGAGVALALAGVFYFLPAPAKTALRLLGTGNAFVGVWP